MLCFLRCTPIKYIVVRNENKVVSEVVHTITLIYKFTQYLPYKFVHTACQLFYQPHSPPPPYCTQPLPPGLFWFINFPIYLASIASFFFCYLLLIWYFCFLPGVSDYSVRSLSFIYFCYQPSCVVIWVFFFVCFIYFPILPPSPPGCPLQCRGSWPIPGVFVGNWLEKRATRLSQSSRGFTAQVCRYDTFFFF